MLPEIPHLSGFGEVAPGFWEHLMAFASPSQSPVSKDDRLGVGGWDREIEKWSVEQLVFSALCLFVYSPPHLRKDVIASIKWAQAVGLLYMKLM